MSQSVESRRIIYNGNGSTTAFSIPFSFQSNTSYVGAKLWTDDDTIVDWVYTTDFTISSTTLTAVVAPASGKKLIIYSKVPLSQTEDYADETPILNSNIENGLDKLAQQIQQLDEAVKRAPKFNMKTSLSNVEMPSTLTANSVLIANAGATGFEWGPTADEIENAQTYAEEASDSADSAAASASSATTSASSASTSASSASTSASAASTSASSASTSASSASTSASSASTSATSAASSATTASTQASAASTSATNAATSETNAAASASSASTSASSASTSATAAAASVAALSATSTTSLAIGTGAKTFTTQSGKLFVAGQFLQIASAANSANYMHGTVTSYSTTSLVMNITDIGGSGTLADWNISISGSQGPTGATGAGFSDGDKGDIVIGGSGTTLTVDAGVITAAKCNADIVSGQTTVTGATGDYLMIGDVSDSTNVKKALASDFISPRSQIIVGRGNGHGSTNTKIRRFLNTLYSVGTAITYADSSTNGGSFTINESGTYCVSYSDERSGGGMTIGIDVNGSSLTTGADSATYSQGMRNVAGAPAGTPANASWCGILSQNDIVRARSNGVVDYDSSDSHCQFSITKVSN